MLDHQRAKETADLRRSIHGSVWLLALLFVHTLIDSTDLVLAWAMHSILRRITPAVARDLPLAVLYAARRVRQFDPIAGLILRPRTEKISFFQVTK